MAEPSNKVTDLSDLRRTFSERELGQIITLSSGITLKLKSPGILNLIRQNKIPTNLISAAMRSVNSQTPMTADQLKENIELIKAVIKECIVEPQGLTDADFDAFQDTELIEMYTFVNTGVKELEKFRRDS